MFILQYYLKLKFKGGSNYDHRTNNAAQRNYRKNQQA